MCYIYVDGDNYLGVTKGSYVPVRNLEKAKKFETRECAENVLGNCVSKTLRCNYNWSLEEIQNNPVNEKINDAYVPVDFGDVKKSLQELSAKFSIIKGNREWLMERQSDIDKQISDILHFIEFERFSACEGFKLCKALKELRLKRREIKNELELINIINCHTCNNIANGSTNKAIYSIENKKYQPRVLSELFESRNVDKLF